jgi:hypothetical protein
MAENTSTTTTHFEDDRNRSSTPAQAGRKI